MDISTKSLNEREGVKNLSKKISFHENYNKSTLSTDLTTKKTRNKNVVVIGLGYVGLPLALLAAQKNYKVTGIDNDEEKIRLIRKQVSPILDKKITEALTTTKISVSTNPIFVRESGIIIICVPTPVDHQSKPDFGPLEKAAENISKHLLPDTLVIVESTVNPGVCESLVLPILESGSGLQAGKDFQLSHCPERINPGDEKWGLDSINRVVGSLTQKGLEQTVEFYGSLIGNEKITPMASIKEAEAVKIVENSFRDINIAFVNELAMSFEVLGIDVVNVIKGASTKPFGFMAHYPGCGVGGHCIPVDPYYLIEHAKKNGFEHKFLITARQINSNMPKYTVKMTELALESKELPVGVGKVTILGASYKPNVDDIRESPSFVIYEELVQKGYSPVIYDPYTKSGSVLSSIDDALNGSVAVIVATGHDQFTELKPDFFESRGVKIVIDGRNCLDKKLFEESELVYRGIGR